MSACTGEMTSVDPRVSAQSNPTASEPWDCCRHSYMQMFIFSIYKFPYLIFLVCLFFLETNTSALIFEAFPWKPVLPWYPIKAFEAISSQVVKITCYLSALLPGVLTWSGCLVWSHLLPLGDSSPGSHSPLGHWKGTQESCQRPALPSSRDL